MDTFLDFIKAFAVGGALCAITQIMIDKTRLTPARILVFYVVLGVALTGVGVYGYVVDFAGCGATLPLTGFGYALAEGVKKAVDEQGLIGALTGGFTATAGGVAAAVTFGFLFSVIFKSKPKK